MNSISLSLLIFAFTCFIELLICFYALIRNNWVYKNRVKLIGTPEYKKLPSYGELLSGHRFWSWNFKSFIKE